MAISEIYVDPSIAGDSGSGTIGDPYGDLEYAIEQTTFDTTNGTRVNIKAGTDEVLAASLETAMADVTVSVAWVPTEAAPLIFQGYTATAGDGGQGGISGGGSVSIYNSSTQDYLHFIDLHLHNTGTNNVLTFDDFCQVKRCEINNNTGHGILCDDQCTITDNYIYNVGTTNKFGISAGASGLIERNFVDLTATNAQYGIYNIGYTLRRNIVIAGTTSTYGIAMATTGSAINNSVYGSGAATGTGIAALAGTIVLDLSNNLVEGFSGTGGVGISFPSDASIHGYDGNAVYDCETAYSVDTSRVFDGGNDNETLTASPFTSAATNDFSPVDTGNVKEGSLPQIVGGGLV